MTEGVNKTLETIRVFLLMGAAGLVIGCLFDVFRAFHISFKGAGEKFDFVSVQITDIIFAISSFCIFTLGLYLFNSGEIRSYCILGAAAGITAYFLLLAPVVNRVLKLIFKAIYSLFYYTGKFFIKIFKKLFTKRN
ncbi:MAG: spore cortex biosynthesis protein YabQ [Clostridia bacterium]